MNLVGRAPKACPIHHRALAPRKRSIRPRGNKLDNNGDTNRELILRRRTEHDEYQQRVLQSDSESVTESEAEVIIPRSPQITNGFLHSISKEEPGNVLSQSRRDPFVTYPIPWDPDVDFIFDYLTHNFGPAMFGYASNSGHDIFYSQANIVLADPAAFHALMIMPAINRDQLTERSLPSARTLWHRSEAIRLIKGRLAHEDSGQCLTEGSMFAIMVLTGIEKQWHSVGIEVEINGLHRLVVHFGGIKEIHRRYPVLELAMYGLALMTPNMINPGSPQIFDAKQPAVHPEQELRNLKSELACFLKSIETKFSRKAAIGHDLRFALSPGTPMYELLVSPPELSGILQSRMATVQRRLCNCAILYLHCAILELNTEDEWQEFVRSLHAINQKQWIWRRSSRMLQWMLITRSGESKLVRADAAWKAFRLVHAVEMLSSETQNRVKEYLIKALSGLPVILSKELNSNPEAGSATRARV